MIEAVINQPVERDLHQREGSRGLREFAQGHFTGKELGAQRMRPMIGASRVLDLSQSYDAPSVQTLDKP